MTSQLEKTSFLSVSPAAMGLIPMENGPVVDQGFGKQLLPPGADFASLVELFLKENPEKGGDAVSPEVPLLEALRDFFDDRRERTASVISEAGSGDQAVLRIFPPGESEEERPAGTPEPHASFYLLIPAGSELASPQSIGRSLPVTETERSSEASEPEEIREPGGDPSGNREVFSGFLVVTPRRDEGEEVQAAVIPVEVERISAEMEENRTEPPTVRLVVSEKKAQSFFVPGVPPVEAAKSTMNEIPGQPRVDSSRPQPLQGERRKIVLKMSVDQEVEFAGRRSTGESGQILKPPVPAVIGRKSLGRPVQSQTLQVPAETSEGLLPLLRKPAIPPESIGKPGFEAPATILSGKPVSGGGEVSSGGEPSPPSSSSFNLSVPEQTFPGDENRLGNGLSLEGKERESIPLLQKTIRPSAGGNEKPAAFPTSGFQGAVRFNAAVAGGLTSPTGIPQNPDRDDRPHGVPRTPPRPHVSPDLETPEGTQLTGGIVREQMETEFPGNPLPKPSEASQPAPGRWRVPEQSDEFLRVRENRAYSRGNIVSPEPSPFPPNHPTSVLDRSRPSFSPPTLTQVEELEVVHQVTRAIRVPQDLRGTEVRVRLVPENLGEVHIRISLAGNGRMEAEFRAQSEQTRRILARQVHHLQGLLSGGTSEHVVVRIGGFGTEPAPSLTAAERNQSQDPGSGGSGRGEGDQQDPPSHRNRKGSSNHGDSRWDELA